MEKRGLEWCKRKRKEGRKEGGEEEGKKVGVLLSVLSSRLFPPLSFFFRPFSRFGCVGVDVESRGGTFYDGRKLDPQKPALWQPDQKLQIGPYFLQWQLAEQIEDNPEEQTPAEPVTELFQVSTEGSQVQASHSNFSVALNPTQATLAPGEQTNLQIDLFNQSSSVLVVKISLTGLPEIATLAQDTVSMTPGARATVPLTFQLPAVEQPLLAGQHPFQLLLHTEGPPVETAVLQGQITILPEELFELSICRPMWQMAAPAA